MKRLTIIAIAMLMAASVFAQRRPKLTPLYYDYIFAMEGLNPGDDMLFDDGLIAGGFTIGKKAVGFIMRNKTTMPIQIVWDETNIIMNGVAKRVMPDGVKYADKDKTHSPTLIPPGAAVEKDMVPVDNIRFFSGAYTGSEWFVSPMLPIHDGGVADQRAQILAKKGEQLSVFMTLQQADTKYYYTWNFYIAEINELANVRSR